MNDVAIAVVRSDANGFCRVELTSPHPIPPLTVCKLYAAKPSDQQGASLEGDAVAWATHHEPPMLFPTRAEAASYCYDGEQPIPLVAKASPDEQRQGGEGSSACPICGTESPHAHLPADITRWLAAQAQRFRSVLGTSLGSINRFDLYEERESGYYSSRMLQRPTGKYVTYDDHLEQMLAASPPTEAAAAVGELPAKWREFADGLDRKHDLTFAQICMRDAVRDCADTLEAALSPTTSAAREGS